MRDVNCIACAVLGRLANRRGPDFGRYSTWAGGAPQRTPLLMRGNDVKSLPLGADTALFNPTFWHTPDRKMGNDKSPRNVAVAIIFDSQTARVLMVTSRKHPNLWICEGSDPPVLLVITSTS